MQLILGSSRQSQFFSSQRQVPVRCQISAQPVFRRLFDLPVDGICWESCLLLSHSCYALDSYGKYIFSSILDPSNTSFLIGLWRKLDWFVLLMALWITRHRTLRWFSTPYSVSYWLTAIWCSYKLSRVLMHLLSTASSLSTRRFDQQERKIRERRIRERLWSYFKKLRRLRN